MKTIKTYLFTTRIKILFDSVAVRIVKMRDIFCHKTAWSYGGKAGNTYLR